MRTFAVCFSSDQDTGRHILDSQTGRMKENSDIKKVIFFQNIRTGQQVNQIIISGMRTVLKYIRLMACGMILHVPRICLVFVND